MAKRQNYKQFTLSGKFKDIIPYWLANACPEIVSKFNRIAEIAPVNFRQF